MTLQPLLQTLHKMANTFFRGSVALSLILCFAFQQSRAIESLQFFSLKDSKFVTASTPDERTSPFHLPFDFAPVAAETEDADESCSNDDVQETDNSIALCSGRFVYDHLITSVLFSYYNQSSLSGHSPLPLFVLHHQWKTHLS